jgi:hypothetical protein
MARIVFFFWQDWSTEKKFNRHLSKGQQSKSGRLPERIYQEELQLPPVTSLSGTRNKKDLRSIRDASKIRVYSSFNFTWTKMRRQMTAKLKLKHITPVSSSMVESMLTLVPLYSALLFDVMFFSMKNGNSSKGHPCHARQDLAPYILFSIYTSATNMNPLKFLPWIISITHTVWWRVKWNDFIQVTFVILLYHRKMLVLLPEA